MRELPPTSRLAVALRGGADYDGWDLRAHLLAGVVDAVNANTHALVQVHSRRRVRPPAAVARPGSAGPGQRRRVVRVAELPDARPAGPPSAGT